MLWVKSFHVIFMVTWFAGLFYLPRLFVYHAICTDREGSERFKVMERKLFFGIMTPGGVLTILFGVWLIVSYAWDVYASQWWLHIKLALVMVLIAYHIYCGKVVLDFRHDRNRRSHIFYRWLNEFPVLILVATVILVIVRPF
jgi:putative membrane protein